jgi:hypothetical protein
MQILIQTYNVPFSILVGIKTFQNECIVIQAFTIVNKIKTFYVNRKANINGYRELELKFPQVPAKLYINIFNKKNGLLLNNEDGSFIIEKFKSIDLKTRPIWLSEKDKEFIKFAQFFCENASYLSASNIVNGKEIPSIYSSDDGTFNIAYYDEIKDKNSGRKLNTPARIGHTTGIIEVSKKDFLKYTVPMRMIILLHEYSHKWKNPENGNEIGYETGADINALNIYLSLGYSEIEALQAFLYVFKGAATDGNHKRYLIIRDFVRKFLSGELKQFVK